SGSERDRSAYPRRAVPFAVSGRLLVEDAAGRGLPPRTARQNRMTNSTPQGPGPEFGSNADATPIDERAAVEEAMSEETAAVGQDDDPIDISRNEGPELTADVEDVDPGSD